MSHYRLGRFVFLSSSLLLLPLACGDSDDGGTTGPDPTGSLEVSLTITGEAPDADGCVFTVDAGNSRRLLAGESTTYTGLSVGQHEVAISDVAGNCEVLGDATRSISVAADQTATSTFAVSCAQGVGAIDVSVTTTGEDLDPDGYDVVIDGGAPAAIGIDESMTVGGLAPDAYSVALEDVAANCSVAGGNPRTVTVTAGQTVAAAFAVTCSSTSGSLRISASTGGEDLDEDGYEVVIDGGAPSSIGINGSMTAGGLAPGDYLVDLQGTAFNCDVAGGNPRTVTVTAGQETQTAFDVTCRYHLYNRIAFVSYRTGPPELHAVEPRVGATVRSLGLLGRTPAVSPEGLHIAYEKNGDIYRANADGTGETRLTNTGDNERDPAWSPDGSRIAYTRNMQPGFQIWIMDADGSNQGTVGTSGQNPTWSPDGSQLAFLDDTPTNQTDIFIINVNGSGRRNLTNHSSNEDSPAWSPLGNFISFDSERSGTQIWLMDPAGGPATNMTGFLVPFARGSTWAPAAAMGAFWSEDSQSNIDIYFYDPAMAALVRLTTHPSIDEDPSWGGGN